MDGERQPGMDSFLRAIRAHWVLVVLIVLTTVGGAVAAITLRAPTYTATAKILVSPLPIDDQTFLGLQIVRDSGDPTRTVQTAAALIESRAAAALAAARLSPGWSAQRVEDATAVQADGQSNLLAITAKAHRPELAARVADEYARSALIVRQRALRGAVSQLMQRLAVRQRSLRIGDPAREDIGRRLNQLEAVRTGQDPTMQLAAPAAIPDVPSDPPPWLLVLVAIVGGLGIGSSVALLRETFRQSIRTEQEFRSSYPLPVLSRVPVDRTAKKGEPSTAPSFVNESYRSAVAQILARTSTPRVIMLTSPSVGDGKTTAAIQVSFAAAASGIRVVLVDLDLRRAAAANVLGIPPDGRLLRAAIDEDMAVDSALTPSRLAPSVRALACSGPVDAALLSRLQRRLRTLLNDLVEEADLVVVDAPSLAYGGDALTYAMDVDDVLLVARMGHTGRSDLERARELLEEGGQRPTGAILIGATKQLPAEYPREQVEMTEREAAVVAGDALVGSGGRRSRPRRN